MSTSWNAKFEGLTKYLFIAPDWPRSLAIIVILGLVIDAASFKTGVGIQLIGTLGYTVPALVAFIITKPLVELYAKKMTWNRSALLALTCTVFCVILSLLPVLFVGNEVYFLTFALAMAFIFALRLLVLVAIADYRISHMLIPALSQSLLGLLAGGLFFGTPFVLLAALLHLFFGAGVIAFIWFVERPLKRNFHISALNFINAFIAHNTDGSKALEEFFREIGEDVYVPQVSLFFTRDGNREGIFTVPNLHPGPMGDIGGGNLPKVIHDALGEDTFVPHGCATHDFNLVSESEISKIIDAIERSRSLVSYTPGATRSRQFTSGSVTVLAQAFGDTLLLVGTRAPEKTEDLEYSLSQIIMAECRDYFPNVAFVDAHNSWVDVTDPVLPGSLTAMEYIQACKDAAKGCSEMEQGTFEIGCSRTLLPFGRADGFGDLGIQVLAVRTGGQTTAYVLFDGNNMVSGIREQLRGHLSTHVDECEIMTTDSHVVNTMSGKNPIGYRIPPDQFIPYVTEAVQKALADLSSARAAGATGLCEGVVVFGSHQVTHLAGTVNGMIVYIGPLGLSILLLAFIISFITYLVIS
jgi:putative membrane protein